MARHFRKTPRALAFAAALRRLERECRGSEYRIQLGAVDVRSGQRMARAQAMLSAAVRVPLNWAR